MTMMNLVITVMAVLLVQTTNTVHGQTERTINIIGLLPTTAKGSGWTGGKACLPAAKMAIRHVNAYSGLLDGYNFTYEWRNTECNAGLGTYRMLEMMGEPPVKHMISGAGCSAVTEATAQLSHLWNLTQLSYGSVSPGLSNRERFPHFFRFNPPDSMVNEGRIAFMQAFDWKRVATINQALEFFSVVIDDFVNTIVHTDSGIDIISQEIFTHNPHSRVVNLKKQDARIIMTACYENMARAMLCSAYKVGLYGPHVVWVFHGWYSSEFWKVKDVDCTEDEMEAVADGIFLTGHYLFNPRPVRGIANLTVDEFLELYKQEALYDAETFNKYRYMSSLCYDNIWVAALALNCTDAFLKQSGHPKTLDQFSYSDSDICDVTMRCMSDVRITGISGNIKFEAGADPIRNIKLERVIDGSRQIVGSYRKDVTPRRIEWNGVPIHWKGGKVPRDSTISRMEEVLIPWLLYVVMTTLAGLGILVTVLLFVFNIYYRNTKTVKLSSPNINNVLLVGCVLTYSNVFLTPGGTSDVTLCLSRTLCFTLGFTVSFSAMLSKTWRVYRIFTNKKLLKRAIKDYQLLVIIGLLSGLVLFVILVWQIFDPQEMIIKDVGKEVIEDGRRKVKIAWKHLAGWLNVAGMVLVLFSITDVALYLFTWMKISVSVRTFIPLTVLYHVVTTPCPFATSDTKIYLSGYDEVIHPFVRVCTSKFSNYFGWTLYIIEGALMCFGAFLAWETRHVQIMALNDSRQIGMCLYNVVILSAVGLTLSLLLQSEIVIVYGITSGCIIIGTTLTQIIIFVPKIMGVYNKSKVGVGATNVFGTNGGHSAGIGTSAVSKMVPMNSQSRST